MTPSYSSDVLVKSYVSILSLRAQDPRAVHICLRGSILAIMVSVTPLVFVTPILHFLFLYYYYYGICSAFHIFTARGLGILHSYPSPRVLCVLIYSVALALYSLYITTFISRTMSETPVPSNIPSSSTLSGPTNSPPSQPASYVSNTTESLGASDGPSGTNVTESPDMPSRPSGGVDQSVTDKCLGIIKEFENGTKSKMWAWFGIQNAIVGALGGEGNKERRNTALGFYYQLLEDTDAKLKSVVATEPKSLRPERNSDKRSSNKQKGRASSGGISK
ncbi:hypothetical protein K435DRAFT_811584 [Dendrothele bispora CBS 962.96]|uniref:Uncharacterized protein n=1 Tax=Dendrothele bispora (strain CBS 962.96) TaxID=1314807 RepID=A0A4S8KRU5_DENBC|nr:hypothetical protein K435DRAFT_811584 [Dendrothele bispora CBS 962.96]